MTLVCIMKKLFRSFIATTAIFLAGITSAQAAGIVFIFGNNVTAERQTALLAAKAEIEQLINFRQNIKVSVSFDDLPCSEFSAVLGSAGPQNAYHSFTGAPQSNVWYVSAQAADIGSASAMAESSHIQGQFNNRLGQSGCLTGTTWYFGTDHNPGSNQVDFLGTAVHEMMHGLGFLSFIGSNGVFSSGLIDNYSSFLMDASTGKSWKTMTNGERAASIVSDGDLVWTGAKTSAMSSLLSAGVNAGRVQLFAPSSYQGGSSTSHFDDAVHYDSDADEVMEHQYEFPNESVMASAAFCDMGWLLLRDTDGDGIDDCQDDEPLSPPPPDTDGDGVSDNLDAFPNNDAAAVDSDGDSMPDAWLPGNPYGCTPNAATCNGLTLDTDSDNDGVADTTDNCPLIANADQKDYNSNGQGDACDPMPMPSVDGLVTKDKTGTVVAFAGDFDGDGYGDFVVGTPGHDVPASPPLKAISSAGKVEIISGATELPIFPLTGSVAKDGFGTAVAGNADVNGDGIADVVVGAPLADDVDNGLKNVGMISVIYGCTAPCTVQHEERYGTETNAMFGAAVALGDFNDDGNADVAVGIPKAVNAQGVKPLKQAGEVKVLSGSNLDAVPLLDVYGETANARAGTALAMGVWDTNPGDELMVGAPNDDDTDDGLTDAGSVRVYSLSNGTTADFFEYGTAAKDYFGAAIAAGADVDGDGLKDWVVGMPGADVFVNGVKKKNAGSIRIFRGSTISLHPELDPLLGAATNEGLGSSLALGDVNDNGFADIVAGTPKAANPTAVPKAIAATGRVRIYFMDGSSFQVLGEPLYGMKKGDLFGASVSAGDIDGDGKADLIIGIPGKDVQSVKLQKDAGGVTVISGADL